MASTSNSQAPSSAPNRLTCAAGGAGFSYSDSLKKLNVRWDDASLDKWLINPDAMAPDTDMSFRLADAAERKAVIAYLKSLGGQ